MNVSKVLMKALRKGQTLEFDPPLSDKDKEALVKSVGQTVCKPLMWVFYQADLKNGIEQMVINEADGKEFILSFKTVEEWKKHTPMLNNQQEVQASVANKAQSGK